MNVLYMVLQHLVNEAVQKSASEGPLLGARHPSPVAHSSERDSVRSPFAGDGNSTLVPRHVADVGVSAYLAKVDRFLSEGSVETCNGTQTELMTSSTQRKAGWSQPEQPQQSVRQERLPCLDGSRSARSCRPVLPSRKESTNWQWSSPKPDWSPML